MLAELATIFGYRHLTDRLIGSDALVTGRRATVLVLAVSAMLAMALAPGCSRKSGDDASPAMRPPVPVLVATAIRQSVPNQLKEIGTVEAYSSIAIKARVEGNLVAVHFKEGDYVHKGQLLFSIDPRPFEAAVKQAQANLARDQANANQARTNAQRYSYLLKEGVGSRQQFDQAYANSASLDATVMADRAAVETAQLNLQYATITSPIEGRTGNLKNHPGDLIKADSDNPMVTIDQVEPIYVAFSIPESDLADVRRGMEVRQLRVSAAIPGDQDAPENGTLAFIDNSVDKTTGTIELKGLFRNQHRQLWPGQFVNATLTLNETPDAVLIPSQAIQNGQQGPFVYVVGSDLKVAMRPIVPGAILDKATVVDRGLAAGETVVTDGQLLLNAGATVKIQSSLGGSGRSS